MIQFVHKNIASRFPGCTVYLAGGYVRDTLLHRAAKDIDAFIHDPVSEVTAAERVKAAFSDLPVVEISGDHQYEPFLRGTFEFGTTQLQVMTTPHATAETLLDSFDWNVSLFAYDGEFRQRTPLEDIGVGKPLRLQNVTHALSTLRRGFRFSERFGMRLEKSDVLSLCNQIVADEAASKARAT